MYGNKLYGEYSARYRFVFVHIVTVVELILYSRHTINNRIEVIFKIQWALELIESCNINKHNVYDLSVFHKIWRTLWKCNVRTVVYWFAIWWCLLRVVTFLMFLFQKQHNKLLERDVEINIYIMYCQENWDSTHYWWGGVFNLQEKLF